ncbi:hypothetical protein ACJ6WE_38375 [Streptomyces sp. MMS24-I31]|uniref:hypothetical protein n=1 Tax=Streptomyces sp. MMS24-I31 TaxID=3351563 RepID=UPI0038969016
MITLSLVTSAVLVGNLASADPAPPWASRANPEVTLQADGSGQRSAQDTVKCTLFANKPNYSGGKITGTGGISSCTPHAPYSCNSEDDVQIYLTAGWTTAASSPRQYNCPPPSRSTTTSLSCDSTSTAYSYRTLTVGSIFYGTTDSGTATSSVLSVKCL